MPKPVYEEGDVTVLWNQAVHTDREVTANRPDIIIKNKKVKTQAIFFYPYLLPFPRLHCLIRKSNGINMFI